MINNIEIDGKTYDINDQRVDEIDEVVVVDPSTLTVEEFHTFSEKFLNGNVTILLKVAPSTRVMVHTVEYGGTEDYGRWEASALTTSAADDVNFTHAEFDLYKVYYDLNENRVYFEKETRDFPASGMSYKHDIYIDAYMSGEGMDNQIYFSFYSSNPTPLTTVSEIAKEPGASVGFETDRTRSILVGTLTNSEECPITRISFDSESEFTVTYVEGIVDGSDVTNTFLWDAELEEVALHVTDTVTEI